MNLDINGFGYILVVLIIGLSLKIYLESDAFNLKCIVSDVDGQQYCVRERAKLELAADLLARTTVKMKGLVKYMKKEYGDRENVKRLVNGFRPKKIVEILPTSKFTAYSENKGQKLAFCVTKTKLGDQLIDENTLMFVAIHEMAHIATKTVGHTDEFWGNFKFMLQSAVKMGIYKPKNYKKKNMLYCGMKITDNPYYDL
jgi:hypothetical protein